MNFIVNIIIVFIMLIRIDVTFTLIIDLSFHWPVSYLSEHLYCKFGPLFHDHVEMHLAEILIFFRTFINIIIIISCNNFRNLNSTQLNSSLFFFFRFSFIFNLAATHFDDLWTIFGRSSLATSEKSVSSPSKWSLLL